MSDTGSEKLNKDQISQHLKSAVDTLTPNVLDRIDLSVPQDVVPYPYYYKSRAGYRRRFAVLAAAACLCILAMGGGSYYYHAMNRVIESVIGLDVNPSVELSVNRKNKVLAAEALNDEAVAILGDMDLEGVDVNVAVNAVVGSMVTQGYFDESDNAILVTVTNDSISKASLLRTSIVSDIEKTLEENQVQAVVYDQQVVLLDDVRELAQQYGISYGKAYFLKELIDQNQELTMDDMEKLSAMTMEEIAAEIAGRSYKLGEFAEQKEETVKETASTETAVVESETESTGESASSASQSDETSVPVETTTPAATTAEETEAEVRHNRVEIDYVDYEDGAVYVYFVTKVKWKNPTVSVFDTDGDSYAAMISDTSGSGCVIEVSGLSGGQSYTFVLGGLYPVEGGGATTVTGYFDKPMIAGELETDDDDEEVTTKAESEETTAASSGAADESPSETETEETTAEKETKEKETETKEKTKEKESPVDETPKTSQTAAEEPED